MVSKIQFTNQDLEWQQVLVPRHYLCFYPSYYLYSWFLSSNGNVDGLNKKVKTSEHMKIPKKNWDFTEIVREDFFHNNFLIVYESKNQTSVNNFKLFLRESWLLGTLSGLPHTYKTSTCSFQPSKTFSPIKKKEQRNNDTKWFKILRNVKTFSFRPNESRYQEVSKRFCIEMAANHIKNRFCQIGSKINCHETSNKKKMNFK